MPGVGSALKSQHVEAGRKAVVSMAKKKSRSSLSLSFFGGADEVTGSRHLLRFRSQSFLLDCGLFQGHRLQAIEKNRVFPFDIERINSVLLSHAHIDHSGGLPLLVRNGYSGPIHCTRATADLCGVMLLDSAFLQEEDAKYFNKIHAAEGARIEPLYTKSDAEKTLRLLEPHDYDEFFLLGDGIRARFLNAGHVLGSAMIELEIITARGIRRIVFTGDLGRQKSLLMKPPIVPAHVDYLLLESTYGSRRHEPMEKMEALFAQLIQETIQNKGRILIPSFALERTQEVVYILEKLRRRRKIPPIHLYVDSPMAANITEIYNRNLDCPCLSAEFRHYVEKEGDPFGMESVRYIRTVEESKMLNEIPGEKIILAGSGMCEGGRILHHLRNYIGHDHTIVLLVGYQAEGTLGRRLAEGAKKVKIFGLPHEVRATTRLLPHLSSHADQEDLTWFVKNMSPRPKRIFLVHGDEEERKGLADRLHLEGVERVVSPRFGEEHNLDL